MSNSTADLNAQIENAKRDLDESKRRTAESRQRSSTGPTTSPITGSARSSPTNGNRATTTAGMEGTKAPGGTRGTGKETDFSQSRPELEPVDEDESDLETTTTSSSQRIPTPSTTTESNSGSRSSRRTQNPTPNPNPSNQNQPTSSRVNFVQDNPVDSNLTQAQNILLRELEDINGQDSYDALAAGVGKLKRDEYLALPDTMQMQRIAPETVGKPAAHAHLNMRTWAQIYALNKARAPEGADAKVFALLRLEAVKCGWIDSQREIVIVPEVPNALRTLAEDMSDLREKAPVIKMASFLLPLIAEHVFRTYGHHFISSDAANYTERYNLTLRSCLAPDVIGLLPPAVMFHTALHWVSPGRAWRVLQAQMYTTTMPDALRIRANAAPAGTAILTTTAAIIDSMEAVKIAHLFAEFGGFDLARIQTVTRTIKLNPPRYHKSYFAYGVNPLNAEETSMVELAKEIAIRFAPFAQAYINTYMREAALGKAQALKKHAEQNPIQLRRAQSLFRAITRKDVYTIRDLFEAQLAQGDIDA